MKTFEVGDIIISHAHPHLSKSLYGMIIGVRTQTTYFVDWFVEESDKHKYAPFMYRNEIEKVSA
jgi:hypothetical protein